MSYASYTNCLQDFSVHAPTSGITKHYEHEHHTRSHSHSHTHTHADALPHPYVQASILSYINVRQGSISAPLSVLFVLAYYQIQWQVAKAFFGQLKFTWHTHTLVI